MFPQSDGGVVDVTAADTDADAGISRRLRLTSGAKYCESGHAVASGSDGEPESSSDAVDGGRLPPSSPPHTIHLYSTIMVEDNKQIKETRTRKKDTDSVLIKVEVGTEPNQNRTNRTIRTDIWKEPNRTRIMPQKICRTRTRHIRRLADFFLHFCR